MATRLGDLLDDARRRTLVGRGRELASFDDVRGVLRDVDAGDLSGDPEKLVRRFDEVTAAVVEPLYRMTLWFDRNRLAELAADAAGAPGQIDDPDGRPARRCSRPAWPMRTYPRLHVGGNAAQPG